MPAVSTQLSRQRVEPVKKVSTKRVSILGVTGSIGQSTLSVIDQNAENYEVVAITGGSNVAALAEAAKRTNAEYVAIADDSKLDELRLALNGFDCEVGAGANSILHAASMPADMIVSAIVGFAGLAPTLSAIEQGACVALANKESLVCAGTYVMSKARAQNISVLPVDSEHNAIFQSLAGSQLDQVETITLTASGGPFRTWGAESIANATVSEALKHPKWEMGRKITIDSASLMNKGLELIEAAHLFEVGLKQLRVLVHPQSVVHGMVSFVDGSVVAELGAPDMCTPIAHCLSYPLRQKVSVERLDLAKVGTLTFEEPDRTRFPALQLAEEALESGDVATNILNAANEVAVDLFLSEKISFSQLTDLLKAAVDNVLKLEDIPATIESYESANQTDSISRVWTFDYALKLGMKV